MSNEEIDIDPIRFESDNELTQESELTDLRGYYKFGEQEHLEPSKVYENEDDDDLDELYGSEFNGVDLTLI